MIPFGGTIASHQLPVASEKAKTCRRGFEQWRNGFHRFQKNPRPSRARDGAPAPSGNQGVSRPPYRGGGPKLSRWLITWSVHMVEHLLSGSTKWIVLRLSKN